ncbi:MAG: hypothetical protein ACREUE_06340, partial [Panacagrimonas sp.]
MLFPSAGRTRAPGRSASFSPRILIALAAATLVPLPFPLAAADEPAPTAPASGIPPGTAPDDAPPAEKAPANPAEPPTSPYGSVKWDYSPLGVYGPTYTSPDQQNRLTVGLFVWFDNSFVLDDKDMADALGRDEIDGESRIATTRLELNGSYTEDYWYYFRVDFQDNGSGSGDSSVEWAALGMSNLPVVQNLLVGLQQPLYSLDVWANYPRHRLMLEPSLVNAFYRGPLLG